MIANPRGRRINSATGGARRGVSLIELLIVISIGGVVVGLCATTMHLILRVERDQARAVRLTAVLSRIRQLFSNDVHGAVLAEIKPGDTDKSQLQLAEDGPGRVVYSADEHILRRERFAGERLEHRDEFHFPLGTRIHFEQEERPRIARLDLEIAAAVPDDFPDRDRGKSSAVRPPRSLAIEALLDRDRRHSRRAP